MDIQANSKLVMIGDSITDCGRARPIGEEYKEPGLGNGYVSFVHGLLSATYPHRRIRIMNMGIGGNTVRDLKLRWQSDVLDLEPDWLSVMIGINDVWRHFDNPLKTEIHVSLDEYAQTLERLVSDIRPRLQGLVLMTPFFIEPLQSDPMRAMMDEYSAVVHNLAARYEARLVDTQTAFDNILQAVHPVQIAADRVHPKTTGHMLIARAFLDAIGYEWLG